MLQADHRLPGPTTCKRCTQVSRLGCSSGEISTWHAILGCWPQLNPQICVRPTFEQPAFSQFSTIMLQSHNANHILFVGSNFSEPAGIIWRT